MYDSGDEGVNGRARPSRNRGQNEDNSASDSKANRRDKKSKAKLGDEYFDGEEELKGDNADGDDDGTTRRSQRQRKPKDYDEGANLDELDADYGREDPDNDLIEAGGVLKKRGIRKSARQASSAKAMAAEDEGDLSGEDRYGLRARKKRMKVDKAAEGNQSKHQSMMHQQSSANLQEKVDSICAPKMWLQMNKRNEKNGIVCAHCMQPET